MSNNASFLPDDYLDQKAERRTNLISLVLFGVVMLGVFLAFLFTNQRWAVVKRDQSQINVRYQQAASQITELLELEEQKGEMLEKAELAAALVERVPRSVLLAELVNRMPDKLSLLAFEMKSEIIKPVTQAPTEQASERLKPRRAKTKKEAVTEARKVRPPKHRVTISLVGVAPSGQEVSRYLAELNAFPLLRDVRLEYTEEREFEDQTLQQYKIVMSLDPSADVRDVEPRIVPRRGPEPNATTFRADNPVTDTRGLPAPSDARAAHPSSGPSGD